MVLRSRVASVGLDLGDDLSDEHSRYNLQVNRAIRKKQKTDKKKARKGGLI